jgi:hypothetical protein
MRKRTKVNTRNKKRDKERSRENERTKKRERKNEIDGGEKTKEGKKEIWRGNEGWKRY